eukprot:CAMPEP_0185776106 /NCGR_PEP_ID=MMETSP1174-20130828/84444_1 /TAXON_ID=35687 /ORGANISM="Dictyocha speculum, Strain CCMP1381" /LENGTH=44 /DNA_ID= /DNA_START= /DNA_END= /DNA_ORIENTATION=
MAGMKDTKGAPDLVHRGGHNFGSTLGTLTLFAAGHKKMERKDGT